MKVRGRLNRGLGRARIRSLVAQNLFPLNEPELGSDGRDRLRGGQHQRAHDGEKDDNQRNGHAAQPGGLDLHRGPAFLEGTARNVNSGRTDALVRVDASSSSHRHASTVARVSRSTADDFTFGNTSAEARSFVPWRQTAPSRKK